MTRHKELIAQLLAQDPTARTTLFMQCAETIISYSVGYVIKPDAWSINILDSKITAYEVECSSTISAAKMANYIDLWWAFDFIEWDFELVTFDRNGVRRTADLFMGPLMMVSAANLDEKAELREVEKLRKAAEVLSF